MPGSGPVRPWRLGKRSSYQGFLARFTITSPGHRAAWRWAKQESRQWSRFAYPWRRKKRPFTTSCHRLPQRARRSQLESRLLQPVASGNEKRIELDTARVDHWVGQGAQMTDKVRNLYKEAGKVVAAQASA